MRRHVPAQTTRSQVVDEDVEGLVGNVPEEPVIDGEAGCSPAVGDALDVLEAEHAIGGGGPRARAQRLLGVIEQLIGATQHARDVRAHRDHVGAHRLGAQHLVERGGAYHLGGLEAHDLGYLGDRLGSQPAVLFLCQMADGYESRARMRVERDQLMGALYHLGREVAAHRSTSPMTGSTDDMVAMASATKPPRSITARLWRFTKDGPLMCIRYGFAESSETM